MNEKEIREKVAAAITVAVATFLATDDTGNYTQPRADFWWAMYNLLPGMKTELEL